MDKRLKHTKIPADNTSKLLTLKDLDLTNKKVFLRVDYNVVENGKVIDEFRVSQSVPTILELLAKNCSVILASHNGRPEGVPDPKLSLRPVAQVLAEILKRDIGFVDDCVGRAVVEETYHMKSGELVLLENLRFHSAEEKNNNAFAKSLASLAEVYVDDAFANAHRAHASMVGIPKYLPHCAGLLMQKEYEVITNLLTIPDRPFVAVIGGAKISTKIDVLMSLLKKVDTLVIGGAMANTFLQAQGYSVGKSMTETNQIEMAKQIISEAHRCNVNLILPTDVMVAKSAKHNVAHHQVRVSQIAKDDIALDLGKDTMKKLIPIINSAKTVFWNGTLGMAEIPEFAWASRDMAHMMAIKNGRVNTIVGGGDTTAFIQKLGMHDSFRFVSTGGGASLELLAGNKLPGIEVLMS